MAKLPVEIIRIGDIFQPELERAIDIANSIQEEFDFQILSKEKESKFQILAFREAKTKELMDEMERIRLDFKGYHPHLLLITDSYLIGEDYANLFGSHRAEKGVAVLTVCGVSEIIIPKSKMVSYFLYYLARYTLSFIYPEKKNHNDTRDCIYDRKIDKKDLLKSMQGRPFCDNCRTELRTGAQALSAEQLQALTTLIELSGKSLNESSDSPSKKPKVFIGSSSEGLKIARKVQSLLSEDAYCQIWTHGTFELGESYLESLEKAVNLNDYGIFIFTPDDKFNIRGNEKSITRDNVIFELGLFMGRLSRKRSFAIHPRDANLHILSDLSGISMASYDPDYFKINEMAALEPACDKIRDAIKKDFSK